MYTLCLSKDFDAGTDEMITLWKNLEMELHWGRVQKEHIHIIMEEYNDSCLFPDQSMVLVNSVVNTYLNVRFEYIAGGGSNLGRYDP